MHTLDRIPRALDGDASEPIIRRAVEAGVTVFDTAPMYSDGVGQGVTEGSCGSPSWRNDYVLATKVFLPLDEGPTTADCPMVAAGAAPGSVPHLTANGV